MRISLTARLLRCFIELVNKKMSEKIDGFISEAASSNVILMKSRRLETVHFLEFEMSM